MFPNAVQHTLLARGQTVAEYVAILWYVDMLITEPLILRLAETLVTKKGKLKMIQT